MSLISRFELSFMYFVCLGYFNTERHRHGPLTRYVKLRVVHAPGMPGMFSSPPTSKETASWRSRHASRHVHHAGTLMHVGITDPRCRRKRSRRSRRMRNPHFYVSGKRPIPRLYLDSFTSIEVFLIKRKYQNLISLMDVIWRWQSNKISIKLYTKMQYDDKNMNEM